MKKENNQIKRPIFLPVLIAVLFSFAGVGAAVYAFNRYFEENPLPVDYLIRTSESDKTSSSEDMSGAPDPLEETREFYAKATEYLSLGKYTEAEQAFRKVLDLEPDNDAAKSGMLQLYESRSLQSIREKDYDAALKDIDTLKKLDESRITVLTSALTDSMNADAAAQAVKTENYDVSKKLYEKILSIDARNLDAYEGLTSLALAKDDYTEAARLIKECKSQTGSDRIERFYSQLPYGLSNALNFTQIASMQDDSDYPVMLFDSEYKRIPETEEVSVVRQPMVTQITEFSKTEPDENGFVTYTVELHHKAHATVMINADSKYAKTGVGLLMSGSFPLVFDYYTGTPISLSEDGKETETSVSWKGTDFWLYTASHGKDLTSEDGKFKRDGNKYVRNIDYDYIKTVTIRCPKEYDGLCFAFYKQSGSDAAFELTSDLYTFVRASEYQNLTVRNEAEPSDPSEASRQASAEPQPSSSQMPQSSEESKQPSSEPQQPSSQTPQSSEESKQPSSEPQPSSSQTPQSSEESKQPSSEPQPSSSQTPQSSEESKQPSSEPQPSSSQAQNSTDSYTDDVIALVNQERANIGLGPVSSTPELTAAAQARASEIIESFSHTRPDGTSCFTILPPYGVTSFLKAGENIAAGQRSPESVMDAWMNSEGHRANILDASFNHIGVGLIIIDSGYRYYWVQLFTD